MRISDWSSDVCSSDLGSRLILHEKIADAFLDKFVALARSIRIGNPLDPNTEMGPLTSAGHRDRVLSYVEVAKQEGDRKSVVKGKSVSVRVDLGGRRVIKKKNMTKRKSV